MFLLDETLCWSASDLTASVRCEYALLRTLDVKLGRAQAAEVAEDPLLRHIAALGDRHEARILTGLRLAGGVTELDHIRPPYTSAGLRAAVDATRAALSSDARVVYQGAFFDGEFFGYADFIERAEDGWLVCDAKLARSAKPAALLQLGAYADQIASLGLPLSETLSLLLGSGERVDVRAADVLPVFRERRERLRVLLGDHHAAGTQAAWGDDRIVACGRCSECAAAAQREQDVVLVAGLRLEQRRRLRKASITTVEALATASQAPPGFPAGTFARLREQAALQWRQRNAGEDAPLEFRLTEDAAATLSRLPAPSPGDLFFDFEGDPLYDEGDPARTGLEYLWGVLDAEGAFHPRWAHSWAEEKTTFEEFIDDVAARRAAHPDLHIYHYAPYETTALKRLAMRYQTREAELDGLLRSEVFVDLYATVKGALQVATPSYSLKKLEPLYMGEDQRSAEGVQAGDASILAYHEFRDWRVTDPAKALAQLEDLEDYNNYDCRSTLRLRDWLLDRAAEAGVRDALVMRIAAVAGDPDSDTSPLFLELMKRSGPDHRHERTPEEQAFAMLATAIDYYRREDKSFWWEHYDRLSHPLPEWAGSRGVFVVESAHVVQDWEVPSKRASNMRRQTRLIGDWAAGSSPDSESPAIYARPAPHGADGPDRAPFAWASVKALTFDDAEPRVVMLTESRKAEERFDDLPVALTPAPPPPSKTLAQAIVETCEAAASNDGLPGTAALDLLARRVPRLRGGAALPVSGSTIDDVVAALTSTDNSYVAVQGPPGTGKTYAGSRVIKRLVEQRGWRVGVVAASHAVAENMLTGIVNAGLDPALVGKSPQGKDKRAASAVPWTVIKGDGKGRQKFLGVHAGTGCVLGGTAWTFAAQSMRDTRPLDLLVVDEAGQFSLAPTLAAAVSARRLLLLGDPQQLPQVSQGTHAEPVDASALGWLMEGHDTLPPEFGYFLGESYRMHPALCQRVSDLSYEGRLTAAEPASSRHLDGLAPGLHVVEVAHTGNRTESPQEAAAVVEWAQKVQGLAWTDPEVGGPRPLGPADVLVVAPYNAQVAMIRQALDAAGLAGVRVGTVDKFQGQEAPIAIVSMTASSHGDVPRGMGFLLNRNRVNVAVSRAQWAAVLVRSEALTSYMPTSTHGLLELGAFIGLCQPPAGSGGPTPAAPSGPSV